MYWRVPPTLALACVLVCTSRYPTWARTNDSQKSSRHFVSKREALEEWILQLLVESMISPTVTGWENQRYACIVYMVWYSGARALAHGNVESAESALAANADVRANARTKGNADSAPSVRIADRNGWVSTFTRAQVDVNYIELLLIRCSWFRLLWMEWAFSLTWRNSSRMGEASTTSSQRSRLAYTCMTNHDSLL